MRKPDISIVVPIYNVESDLQRCVESLINQTYRNIEIILVDDGSSDNCPEICDDYAEKDSRVKVIHKQNGGLSDARNKGLREAIGNFVLFVDSDDFIELESCEYFLNLYDGKSDIVVGVAKQIKGEKLQFLRHKGLKSNCTYNSKEFIINSIQHNEWYAPAWLNLYRRDFLIQNNLEYKKGIYFEDIEMLPRLFLAANLIQYVDFPFYNYIIRENSIMTSLKNETYAKDSLWIYNNWFDIFKKVNDDELKKYLNGALVKYYLSNCRAWKVNSWKIKGLDFKFSVKNSLNLKEKFKVYLFNFFPNLYIR